MRKMNQLKPRRQSVDKIFAKKGETEREGNLKEKSRRDKEVGIIEKGGENNRVTGTEREGMERKYRKVEEKA